MRCAAVAPVSIALSMLGDAAVERRGDIAGQVADHLAGDERRRDDDGGASPDGLLPAVLLETWC
jgi:hypothetical protein